MTNNQLQYQRNLETERANRESERLRGLELGAEWAKAQAAMNSSSAALRQARTADESQRWQNILRTLKYILPEAGDALKAAGNFI